MKPYIDEIQFDLFNDKKHIRTFLDTVDSDELIWHRDKKDRTIKVIESNNWKLQIDNELPIPLLMGQDYEIKKEVYHRVHKGKGKLVVEIKEYD